MFKISNKFINSWKSPFNLILELPLLFLSLKLSIYLRGIIPIGQQIVGQIIIIPSTFFALAILWIGGRNLLRSNFSFKKINPITIFLIGTAIFTFIQFALLRANNYSSISRLLIFYLLFLNIVGVLLARWIVFKNPKTLETTPKVWINIQLFSRRIERHLDLMVGGLAGIFWARHVMKFGLTYTPDSVVYISLAQNLNEGLSPLHSHWPPFYSILISLFSLFNPFLGDSAAFLSGTTVLLYFVFFALLLRQISNNVIINSLLILLLASLRQFNFIFERLWSEQLFSLEILLIIYLIFLHENTGKTKYFAWAAIITAFSMVTRIAGLSLGAILLVYSYFATIRGKKLKEINWKIFQYSMLSFTFYLVYLIANSIREGPNLGHEFVSLDFLGAIISSTSLIWSDIGNPYISLFIPLSIFLIVISKINTISKHQKSQFWIILLFISGYFAFILTAIATTRIVPVTRFFSPIYFLILLVLPLYIRIDSEPAIQSNRFRNFPRDLSRYIVYGFLAFIALLQVSQYLTGHREVSNRVHEIATSPRFHGFGHSPTSEGFRNFFGSHFKKHEEIVLFVIEDEYDYSKSFLNKSSLIQNQEFKDIFFSNNYVVTFYLDKNKKQINQYVQNVDLPNTSIENILETLIESYEEIDLYLVVNQKWLEQPRNQQRESEFLALSSSQSPILIEPYLLYAILK